MDTWTDGFSGKIADTLATIGAATNPASGIPQTVGPMLQSNAAQTKSERGYPHAGANAGS